MGTISKISKNRGGLTFIEMVVAVGVIAFLLPALFTIFYALIFQQTKVYHLTEVKRQGDFALEVIRNTIKNNANEIHDLTPCSNFGSIGVGNTTCATGGSSFSSVQQGNDFCFVDKNGKTFYFYANNGKIASNSAAFPAPTPVDLTTNKITITNFSISCSRTQLFSPALVTISFNVGYSGAVRTEETASLNYQTSIKLKNY